MTIKVTRYSWGEQSSKMKVLSTRAFSHAKPATYHYCDRYSNRPVSIVKLH